MVLMLPALFLSLRATLISPSRWRSAALAVIGLTLLGTKQFVLGKDWSLLALSYKVDTVACLLLLVLVLTLPKRGGAVGSIPGIGESAPLAKAA